MSGFSSSPPARRIQVRFLLAAGVSVLFWVLLQAVSPGEMIPWTPPMSAAASAMDSAVAKVALHCRDSGIPVDPGVDPNRTCFLGPEISPLFTSLGQVQAKRTTLTPDVAGLLAHLLHRAGVSAGDRVAIGGSGSFPGFLAAVLIAVRALDAEPVTILSLGASSFGATRPRFHVLDLYRLLRAEGYVGRDVAAVSLGGAEDVGREFDPAFRDSLISELERDPAVLIGEAELQENVAVRMRLYGAPVVFVNIGGAEANLGVSPRILALPPGLVENVTDFPPSEERGVVFEMLARGIPVLHLLHVRGLALRYGLPWDPIPLPPPGSTSLRDTHEGRSAWLWLLTLGYAGSLALVAGGGWRRGREGPGEVPGAEVGGPPGDGAAREMRT